MRAALLCLCLVVVAGCKVKNPNYCEDTDDHLCMQPDAKPMVCEESSDCTGALKICEMDVCVECTPAEDDACMGTKPFCDMNACRACKKHSDCPDSNACLPDGSCAAPGDVAYASASGAGTACTKATPCGDVTTALAVAPPKPYIRLEGTIVAPGTTQINNRNVTLLGDSGTSKLQRTGGDVLSIDGTSIVRIYDLAISGAVGNTGVSGLSSHTGTLELQRCTVSNNSLGISYAGTGTLILSRSTVSENVLLGGVSITGNAKFDITNNFIVRNGNDTNGMFGGLSLLAGVASGSRLEFNTIVENKNTEGSSRAGGLFCDVNALVVPNNLIAGNFAPTPARAQTNGICTSTGSLVQGDLTGLMFQNATMSPYNYHLKPGTTGGINTASGTLMVDFDGEARPNGAAPDMGADELYP